MTEEQQSIDHVQLGEEASRAEKPLSLPCEIIYLLAIPITTLGIAFITKSGWGNAAGTAMAYILSHRFTTLSFGVWSYLVQGAVICVMMALIREAKITYFFSFLTAMANGYCLDFWMWLFTGWQPRGFGENALAFGAGFLFSGLGFMMFIKSRLPAVAYELFVREMMRVRPVGLLKIKLLLDGGLLGVDFILTLLFFQTVIGIGLGTVLSTAVMGLYMHRIDQFANRYCTFDPLFLKMLNPVAPSLPQPPAAAAPSSEGAQEDEAKNF